MEKILVIYKYEEKNIYCRRLGKEKKDGLSKYLYCQVD